LKYNTKEYVNYLNMRNNGVKVIREKRKVIFGKT